MKWRKKSNIIYLSHSVGSDEEAKFKGKNPLKKKKKKKEGKNKKKKEKDKNSLHKLKPFAFKTGVTRKHFTKSALKFLSGPTIRESQH